MCAVYCCLGVSIGWIEVCPRGHLVDVEKTKSVPIQRRLGGTNQHYNRWVSRAFSFARRGMRQDCYGHDRDSKRYG